MTSWSKGHLVIKSWITQVKKILRAEETVNGKGKQMEKGKTWRQELHFYKRKVTTTKEKNFKRKQKNIIALCNGDAYLKSNIYLLSFE